MMNFSDVTVSMQGVLSVLYALVAVMIIVVLYHLLFIVVDLRKVLRRVDDVTEQVEAMILKPISMADQILQWVLDHIEAKKKHKHVKLHDEE